MIGKQVPGGHGFPLFFYLESARAGWVRQAAADRSDRQGRMVYVDTASGGALAMDIAGEFPAIHPRTGKRTLMPALYCPKCGKWHPVPPPDQINRTARAAQCPKTGEPLTPDGPWPGEDANVPPP